MKKSIREIIMLFFILIPQLYLFQIWDQLPATVPTHFNLEGEADDWQSKSILIWMPGAITLGIYLLTLLLPSIDPKGKMSQMGEKFQHFRLFLFFFLGALHLYLLYKTQSGHLHEPNTLIALAGAIMTIIGNYMQTLRPNYFIGIRNPWTLESENVWRKTHRFGSKLWLGSGLIIIIAAMLLSQTTTLAYITIGSALIASIVPIIYSYQMHRKEHLST